MSEQNKHHSHLEAIANAMPDPIFIMGQDGTYLDIVGGSDRSLYADGSQLIGKNYRDVLPEKMAARFLKVVEKAILSNTLQEVEYQLANSDVNGVESGPTGGQWYEARVYPIQTDEYGQPAVIWLAINITARKHAEEQLEHLSANDPLTNLYNRDFFLDLMNEELNRSKMNNQPMSLIKVNIDCFKNITDGYGHEMGDKAIAGAAQAIEKVVGDMGHVGRMSCDQFLVALPEVKGVDALRIGKLIQERIVAKKIDLGDGNLTCLTSHAGVTEVRSDTEDSQTLLLRVNEAISNLAQSREIIKIM